MRLADPTERPVKEPIRRGAPVTTSEREAASTGDLIHNADPVICAHFDFDQKVGLATRQAFISNHADRDVLVLKEFPHPRDHFFQALDLIKTQKIIRCETITSGA